MIKRLSGAKVVLHHLLCLIEYPILVLPSITREWNPRYLNFFREHWTRFLKRCSTLVLEVLIFIPAMSHAAAMPFNACWKPDSKLKSIAHFSNQSIECQFAHPPIIIGCKNYSPKMMLIFFKVLVKDCALKFFEKIGSA